MELNTTAVIGAFLIQILGLWLVWSRLQAKQALFGADSTRTIGIVLFLPTIIILAALAKFQAETLAALLGTVAGYVLSHVPRENRLETKSLDHGSKPSDQGIHQGSRGTVTGQAMALDESAEGSSATR